MQLVQKMKERFPDKFILTDMKTCDAGKNETLLAFEAGADLTTVMSFSANQTITDSLWVAKQFNKQVVVDLHGVSCIERILELKEIGVEAVSIHIGKDTQEQNSFEFLNDYKKVLSNLKIFVAGGIDPDRALNFSEVDPDVYIVGEYITCASNPVESAKRMREVIDNYERNSSKNN